MSHLISQPPPHVPFASLRGNLEISVKAEAYIAQHSNASLASPARSAASESRDVHQKQQTESHIPELQSQPQQRKQRQQTVRDSDQATGFDNPFQLSGQTAATSDSLIQYGTSLPNPYSEALLAASNPHTNQNHDQPPRPWSPSAVDPSFFTIGLQSEIAFDGAIDDAINVASPPPHNPPTKRPRIQRHMPSLQELRALKDHPEPVSPLSLQSKTDSIINTDCNTVISGLMPFVSGTFETHTELAGISSAIAEYLAWMRRSLTTPPQESLKEKWEPVLQVLEERTREMHHLSKTSHWALWRQLQDVIEGVDGVGPEVTRLSSEIAQHIAKRDSFFQNNYDICTDLTEQE